MDFTLLLHTAITAAVEGGDAIMEVYNTAFDVSYKTDDSPLTQADKNANKIIVRHLKKTQIPIISEESKQLPYSNRKDFTYCWIVDPLDGTKEFVKRNGEFTVNIALIHLGKPVLGVIYVPVTRQLYFTNAAGTQAFKSLYSTSQSLAQLTANAVALAPQQNQTVVQVVASRSHMNNETQDFVANLQQKYRQEIEIVSIGSSLKFCLVAEGKASVYPRFAPTMEWDTAAGHAICKAVGVRVLHWETKEELIYNKENLLNPWFICLPNTMV
jgi:3'(2'), 5'-bisphosphate nucleotidase